MIKFQRADHTFDIVCVDVLCAFGIYFAKFLVEILSSFFFCKLLQFLPVRSFLFCLCEINVSGHCLNVKSGAAYQDRDLAFGIDLFQGGFCQFLKFYDMKFIPL